MSVNTKIDKNLQDDILKYQISQKRLKYGWNIPRICKEFNLQPKQVEKLLLLWMREALGEEENTKRLITELALVRFQELIDKVYQELSKIDEIDSNTFKSLCKLFIDLQKSELSAAGIIKDTPSKNNSDDLQELQEQAKQLGITV